MAGVFERVEPAVAALFARFQTAPIASSLKTITRAHRLPGDVGAEQQPALILVMMELQMVNPLSTRTPVQPGHPYTLLAHMNVYIYATQEPDDLNPESQLHGLAAQVEQTIRWSDTLGDIYHPRDTENANLGGLAYRVNVEGPVAIVQDPAGQQGQVIMPIEMLLTEE